MVLEKKHAQTSMRTDRVLIVDKQINVIDRFRIALMEPEYKPREFANIPRFIPLIVVAPFHYSYINEIFPEKIRENSWYSILRELYQSEQDMDYRSSIDPEKVDDMAKLAATF